jgi:hypothetical protein
MNRRQILGCIAASAVLPLCAASRGQAVPGGSAGLSTPVSVILPNENTLPPPGKQRTLYQKRLVHAVLDFIESHYAGGTMPVWEERFDKVDMEKRILNIAYWVIKASDEASGLYFVDPAWIMAQITAESFFYEFAVSEAFAVGICQFIVPTAHRYGMITPDKLKFDTSRVREKNLAGELDRLYELLGQRKRLLRENSELFRNRDSVLHECLSALAEERPLPEARGWLQALYGKKELDRSIVEARSNYRKFLEANFRGRSIFDSQDLRFLVRFDERVTYRKPLYAMVRMMAEHLRFRNGNLLAATAGYNAGLVRTNSKYKIYRSYGRIPHIEETVTYVNRIVVNHHEITKRFRS